MSMHMLQGKQNGIPQSLENKGKLRQLVAFGVRDFFVEKRSVPGTLCAKNESGNETRGIVFGRSGGAGAEPQS